MAKTSLTLTIRVDGVRETMAAFQKLPKEANNSLRDETLKLSKRLAAYVVTAGRKEGSQAALVAQTVKARRDRVPVIQAGGTKRLGSRRAPAYKLLFGSEFGANYLRQFKPHLGRGSYWFFRTVEKEEDEIAAAWRKVADDIAERFARG